MCQVAFAKAVIFDAELSGLVEDAAPELTASGPPRCRPKRHIHSQTTHTRTNTPPTSRRVSPFLRIVCSSAARHAHSELQCVLRATRTRDASRAAQSAYK
jgi:hypothetical protein